MGPANPDQDYYKFFRLPLDTQNKDPRNFRVVAKIKLGEIPSDAYTTSFVQP